MKHLIRLGKDVLLVMLTILAVMWLATAPHFWLMLLIAASVAAVVIAFVLICMAMAGPGPYVDDDRHDWLD